MRNHTMVTRPTISFHSDTNANFSMIKPGLNIALLNQSIVMSGLGYRKIPQLIIIKLH